MKEKGVEVIGQLVNGLKKYPKAALCWLKRKSAEIELGKPGKERKKD